VKDQFTYGMEHDFLDSCEPLHVDCSTILLVISIHFCRRFNMQKGSFLGYSSSNNNSLRKHIIFRMDDIMKKGGSHENYYGKEEEWDGRGVGFEPTTSGL
jgi:hypothetical protein